MTVGDALRQGREILERGGIAEARLTAEVLLCHAAGRDRTYLFAHPEAELSEVQWIHFGRYLHERLGGKPAQYITKRQEFWGREFRVTPAVLIPRRETEHVVEAALRVARGARRILDIGTGSGALAITLSLELEAGAVATDISLEALLIARENARALGARVEFVVSDLASAIGGRFDLVVANPPYIPTGEIPSVQREVREFEPRVALDGGEDGIRHYRRIIPQAEGLLEPGGWLIFEIGYQGEAGVRRAFEGPWRKVETGHDLAGLPRVIQAQYAP